MKVDKRPKNKSGELYNACKTCNIGPQECKGFCVIQRIEAEAEAETIRRKNNGSRI